MKDLKLDFLNKTMLNEAIDKKERVVQQITVACRSWLGDFFLDEDFGVDYDNSWGNSRFLELSIRQQIENIPDVDYIKNIEVIIDKSNKQAKTYILNVTLSYNKDIFEISNLII